MEITTDHEILQEKFYETVEELNKLELDLHTISKYSIKRNDTNFPNRSRKTDESLYENYRYFVPVKDSLSKETSPKLSIEDSSSSSPEKRAFKEELPTKKVCLQSAVRAVTKAQSKKEVISKQNINKNVRLRNQRVLGMLQSTLQKFQDDAVKRKPQDLKRMAVELKIEAAKEDAKRRIEKEESDLNEKIKEKKLQLDCLEQMMGITESFHTWKSNMNNSLNFIMTETEPRICYLPASHNASSKKKFEQSRLEMLENIIQQEQEVVNKLAMIKDSCEAEDIYKEEEI